MNELLRLHSGNVTKTSGPLQWRYDFIYVVHGDRFSLVFTNYVVLVFTLRAIFGPLQIIWAGRRRFPVRKHRIGDQRARALLVSIEGLCRKDETA